MPPLVLLLVIILSIARPSTTAAGESSRNSDLIYMQFLHRHGARIPPTIKDNVFDYDHCDLSESGALMALSLGRYLKSLYGWDSPNPLFPREYNYTIFNSHSTDFERTVRTGMGVLKGIYNSSQNEIPYLYHQDGTYDLLLNYFYSWPAAQLREFYINSFPKLNNKRTLELFTQDEINKFGEITQLTNCATEPTLCGLAAEDLGTCERSNGPNFNPFLKEYLNNHNGKLIQLQSEMLSFQYIWSRSDNFWSQVGPLARVLAQRWLANFRTALAANDKTLPENERPFSPKVNHFSAHDNTIFGFFVATGIINASTTNLTALVPDFTSVVHAELDADGMVYLKYSRCEQDYGSGFQFHQVSEDLIQWACMKSEGSSSSQKDQQVYYSHKCPLEDLARYIDTVFAPKFQGTINPDASWCYADPADLPMNNCTAMGESTTSALGEHCKSYRYLCGAQTDVCDAGYVLDRRTMACVKLVPLEGSYKMTVGLGFATSLSSLVAGLVLGALVQVYARNEEKSKKSTTTAPPAAVMEKGETNNNSNHVADEKQSLLLNRTETPYGGC